MGIEWVTLLIGAVIFFGIRAAAGAGVGAILLVTAAAVVLLGGGATGTGSTDLRELLSIDSAPAVEEQSCEWQEGQGGLVKLHNSAETPISFRLRAVLGGDLRRQSRELSYPADGVFTLGPGETTAKLLMPPDTNQSLDAITWCDARMVDIESW